MTQRGTAERTRPISTSYLERLGRRLPGVRSWSGRKERELWPDSAKLVISLSLHWETGHEEQIAPSGSAPDSAQEREQYWAVWHEYGVKEGIPRLLEIFTRRRIRVTCAMTGAAADQYPALAYEVVERGHEAAIHGRIRLPAPSRGMKRAATVKVTSGVSSQQRVLGRSASMPFGPLDLCLT